MAPPTKRSLPRPLPEGFVLTDSEKKRWIVGKKIGQGGCGLIYLASRDVDRPVPENTEYVVKVEYQENGPLFSELKFYQRAAKPHSMQRWRTSRNLDFLGIPTYWGSGLAECNDLRYRFMVMDRLGSDLQKVFERNGGRLKKSTVLQLGQRLVDVLEYIHDNEYVHADIKAANLMLGFKDPEKVYLADYGLSYRYCPDGVHKVYKENPKKGHNGTIEYTSLDAHKGLAPSRRGDLQILGFCLLHWLCGSLPWDQVLKNPTQVQEAKTRLVTDLPDSVLHLSVGGASTEELAAFLDYVRTLDYEQKPDYQHLRDLLASDGMGRLDLDWPGGSAGPAGSRSGGPAGGSRPGGPAPGSAGTRPGGRAGGSRPGGPAPGGPAGSRPGGPAGGSRPGGPAGGSKPGGPAGGPSSKDPHPPTRDKRPRGPERPRPQHPRDHVQLDYRDRRTAEDLIEDRGGFPPWNKRVLQRHSVRDQISGLDQGGGPMWSGGPTWSGGPDQRRGPIWSGGPDQDGGPTWSGGPDQGRGPTWSGGLDQDGGPMWSGGPTWSSGLVFWVVVFLVLLAVSSQKSP